MPTLGLGGKFWHCFVLRNFANVCIDVNYNRATHSAIQFEAFLVHIEKREGSVS